MTSKDDLPTITALAVLATCLVTFDHEALGHGTACLLVGGHITLLSSSVFRCSVHAQGIDPAGPAMNLFMGTLALIAGRFAVAPATRLFLLVVTCLSYGWEGGYLVQAMIKQDGDLYFAARDAFGPLSPTWRIAGGAVGVVLYLVNIRLASAGLLRLWPEAARARRVARIAGLTAIAAATFGALAYTGTGWHDLHDAVLEIAAGALPLLIIPRRDGKAGEGASLPRNWTVIVIAILVFGVFIATLGRSLSL